MLRLLSVTAIGAALTLAACTSGPSWDQPGRSVSTSDHSGDMNSGSMADNSNAGNSSATAQDKDFVMSASAGGAYEIQASQAALQKTQSPRVRMIAQRMVRDHTKAGKQLASIAQKEGIMASDSPNADQEQMISKLNGLSGDGFDQEYLSQQKTAHEQTIDLFKQEASGGNDPQLKTFASNTLPTLEEHLRMINGDNTDMSMGQK